MYLVPLNASTQSLQRFCAVQRSSASEPSPSSTTTRSVTTMSTDPRREDVLRALRTVQDPDLHRDLVSLGMIQDLKIDGDRVSFAIVLTTPACPVRDSMKEESERAVETLPWVKTVSVDMQAST